jgi:hypothetical protein
MNRLAGLAYEIAFWLNLGLQFGGGEGSTGPIVDTAFEVDRKYEGSIDASDASDASEPMTGSRWFGARSRRSIGSLSGSRTSASDR